MKGYLYILWVGLTLLAACNVAEEAPDFTMPEKPVSQTRDITVTLVASAPPSNETPWASQGDTWGDPYPEEQGISFENVIKNVDIYILTPDNHVYPLAPKLINNESGVRQYQMQLNLGDEYITSTPQGTYLLSGRIVAIANYPYPTPASPLTLDPFDIDEVIGLRAIPMWGATTVKNISLNTNETVDIGNIELLRSVPKISFELSDEIKDNYKIIDISTPYQEFASTGYCQPEGCLTAKSTSALYMENCFNPAEGDTSIPNNYFGLNSSQVTLYLPESKLSRDDKGLPPYFEITLVRVRELEAPVKGRVYLCDYAGKEPDYSSAFEGLVRNHDYKYVISLDKLEFLVSFKEWIFGGKVHIELE